jgi:hypothetical protein
MRSYFSLLIIISASLSLTGCEEFVSKNFDNENVKKLRAENTSLKIQLDKIQRQVKKDKEDAVTKDIVISLYDLRHALEKYALENNGSYPEAEGLIDLSKIVKSSLPEDFALESTYLETIKSTTKGYIFIANVNNKKIVVSNLM